MLLLTIINAISAVPSTVFYEKTNEPTCTNNCAFKENYGLHERLTIFKNGILGETSKNERGFTETSMACELDKKGCLTVSMCSDCWYKCKQFLLFHKKAPAFYSVNSNKIMLGWKCFIPMDLKHNCLSRKLTMYDKEKESNVEYRTIYAYFVKTNHQNNAPLVHAGLLILPGENDKTVPQILSATEHFVKHGVFGEWFNMDYEYEKLNPYDKLSIVEMFKDNNPTHTGSNDAISNLLDRSMLLVNKRLDLVTPKSESKVNIKSVVIYSVVIVVLALAFVYGMIRILMAKRI